MAVRSGYKQTEVGVIPEDWETKPLKENILIAHGFPFSSEYFGSNGSYRLTTPGHFYEEGGFRDIGEKQKYYAGPVPRDYVLQPGDLIIAMTEQADGLLGSAAFIPEVEGYLHNQRLGRVKALSLEVEMRFLYYVFNSNYYRAKLRETAAGTKVKHTSPEKLLEISVPMPSPPEQRAIAGALGDVYALIDGLDRLIAKKRDLKQAAMQQLLTGQTRLPSFSGEWEAKRFSDLFQFLRTANNPRADLSTFGDVAYIHYGDIHTTNSAFLDCSQASLPLIAKDRIAGIPFVEEGDLVMTDASEDYAGIGKSVEAHSVKDCKVVAGLHTFLLRGSKELLADGFKGYLQFIPSVKAAMIRLATGISVYGISKNSVRSIEVRLPKFAEQSAITNILSDMDAEIEALEQRRAKTRALKQGMMQELLTGRTRLV
jgi:type I restriction enzyme, S subunit